MYVCVRVRLYVRMCTWLSEDSCVVQYVCMCVCVWLCMCVCVRVRMCACVCIACYIRTYVHILLYSMFVYACVHIRTYSIFAYIVHCPMVIQHAVCTVGQYVRTYASVVRSSCECVVAVTYMRTSTIMCVAQPVLHSHVCSTASVALSCV